MALPTRIVRVSRVKVDATFYTGITRAGWNTRKLIRRGISDGEIGNTSADTVSWQVTGVLEFNNIDQALVFMALATVANLKVEYIVSGGTKKHRVFDNVFFHEAGEVTLPPVDEEGETGRYQIGFTGIFAEANTGLFGAGTAGATEIVSGAIV